MFNGLEDVQSLALEMCTKEIETACSILGISSDPFNWTVSNVRSWVSWQMQQYNLPFINLDYFNMNGIELCSLSPEEFVQRSSPAAAEVLFAQLDIWKTVKVTDLDFDKSIWHLIHPAVKEEDFMEEGSDDGCDRLSTAGSLVSSSSLTSLAISSPAASSSSSSSSSSGRSSSGSHIHLWQFLKELLGQPQLYGSSIRWLDRSKGVFKIEDSVKVARLWGKRKNRPAMNYDKLSRSIRQYYKKGIMKKTERSQRLVYQFCHPYAL